MVSLNVWLIGSAAALFAIAMIVSGPSIVTHLIGKYLLKRRIAWVSLAAVMLCTTMVVVVRSVMGGWLDMFRESFHGLTGDVVIQGESLTGFPYYQEIINKIEALPEIEAAAPTIYSFGLINIANRKSDGVQVVGYPIEKIGRIHAFPASLHRQNKSLIDEADDPKTSPTRAKLLRKMAEIPPSFELRMTTRVPLEQPPQGVDLGSDPERLHYDAAHKQLIYRGVMTKSERDAFLSASADATFQEAIRIIYDRSNSNVVEYSSLLARSRTDTTKWPGIIAGVGVVNIKKDREGKIVGRTPGLFELPVKLTVMGMQPGSVSVDMAEKAEKNFWIVDDSRTGVWQFDSKTVYVDFDILQGMLGMGEKTGVDKDTNKKFVDPARATDIQVKVKAGVDLQVAKEKVNKVVQEVFAFHEPENTFSGEIPTVETWEEDKATFISAIENETVLVTFLFGIISIVAIFLIFCIFYMIVVEKTKDIGIIKSVGATATGVAGIFLGYGLAIGLVGGALGLLLSYLIVTNINAIHSKLGEWLGIQIWNPEVYVFDKIPNQMNPRDVAIITVAMVVASVFGALVPAIIAASKKPVDALRWE